MANNVWSELHKFYSAEDWINKPSIFAETALSYLPKTGRILDLGAGQGQDSRYFASHGYSVVSTDVEQSALDQSNAKITDDIRERLALQRVDLREALPYDDEAFDVVYAHLSLHYFDQVTTERIFNEIHRVLKPRGILAFFVNSTDDPEYGTGKKLETDYFVIDDTSKRYFSVPTAQAYAHRFKELLADNKGETYKDSAKGVHNLVRYIGVRI